MKGFHGTSIALLAALTAAFAVGTACRAAGGPEHALARQILDATGFRGGRVVHLGCGEPPAGRLTAALRFGDGCLVQGLDADAQHVQSGRDPLATLTKWVPRLLEVVVGRESRWLAQRMVRWRCYRGCGPQNRPTANHAPAKYVVGVAGPWRLPARIGFRQNTNCWPDCEGPHLRRY